MSISSTFSALILAGGESSRMGRDKAFCLFEGETLLQRQLRIVRQLGASQVMISGRPEADYSDCEAEIVYDDPPACGPLGGMIAGFRHAQHPLLFVLAVDMPYISLAFLQRLDATRSETTGAVPVDPDGRIEPLCAWYPCSLLAEGLRLRASGFAAPRELVRLAIHSASMKLYPLLSEETALLRSVNLSWGIGGRP